MDRHDSGKKCFDAFLDHDQACFFFGLDTCRGKQKENELDKLYFYKLNKYCGSPLLEVFLRV